jgi:hypothetical protein
MRYLFGTPKFKTRIFSINQKRSKEVSDYFFQNRHLTFVCRYFSSFKAYTNHLFWCFAAALRIFSGVLDSRTINHVTSTDSRPVSYPARTHTVPGRYRPADCIEGSALLAAAICRRPFSPSGIRGNNDLVDAEIVLSPGESPASIRAQREPEMGPKVGPEKSC